MASYIYVSLLFILLTNKPFKLVVVEGPSTIYMASYIYVSLLFILLTNKPFKLVVVEGPSTWHRTFT